MRGAGGRRPSEGCGSGSFAAGHTGPALPGVRGWKCTGPHNGTSGTGNPSPMAPFLRLTAAPPLKGEAFVGRDDPARQKRSHFVHGFQRRETFRCHFERSEESFVTVCRKIFVALPRGCCLCHWQHSPSSLRMTRMWVQTGRLAAAYGQAALRRRQQILHSDQDGRKNAGDGISVLWLHQRQPLAMPREKE